MTIAPVNIIMIVTTTDIMMIHISIRLSPLKFILMYEQ